ncbi:MAG: hypothetical protein GX624_12955 [Actinobacteria bacterium]|nr:hypothetical protein [Actinomycetota bacterium]
MAYCEKIKRSIEVDVSPEEANQEWTQFIVYTFFLPDQTPSVREAEPDEGLVRMEELGPDRTRVTVDLNYCPQWEDIQDEREIADASRHLDWVLARYKEFLESRRVRMRKAA